MSDFWFYFNIGWKHILSFGAIDHQLFILSLIAIYTFKELKPILILVTAFTIGHSLTLAFSAFDIIHVSNKWVEFLIPCTIIVTSISNFFIKAKTKSNIQLNYYFALLFGMIHGLGFASNIKIMLSPDQKFVWSLGSFNIGLEFGQIVLVIAFLICTFIVTIVFKINKRDWMLFLTSCAFALAVQMAIHRNPF